MTVSATVRDSGTVAILDLSGRITLGEGAGLLRNTVKDLVAAGKNKILINLGNVSYVDSSGLAELAGAYVMVSNIGGQLKLLNPQPRLKELLQITRLYTLFVTFDNEAEGVKSFA